MIICPVAEIDTVRVLPFWEETVMYAATYDEGSDELKSVRIIAFGLGRTNVTVVHPKLPGAQESAPEGSGEGHAPAHCIGPVPWSAQKLSSIKKFLRVKFSTTDAEPSS